MVATKGGKPLRILSQKATIVANRSHGSLLWRLNSYFTTYIP